MNTGIFNNIKVSLLHCSTISFSYFVLFFSWTKGVKYSMKKGGINKAHAANSGNSFLKLAYKIVYINKIVL
jgi:hypothetical protein